MLASKVTGSSSSCMNDSGIPSAVPGMTVARASFKSQDDALYADMWAFVFWCGGLPDWQPRFPPGEPRKVVRVQ